MGLAKTKTALIVTTLAVVMFTAGHAHAAGKTGGGKSTSKKEEKQTAFGLKPGVKAPAFSAKADDGHVFTLSDALKAGPVVVVFYRGGWCPFCQRQIIDLQANHGEFIKRHATLVALSVDKVENAEKTRNDKKLSFFLLSNPDADIINKYRLSLTLDAETLKKYKSYSIDVEAASGKKHHIIAVPAVYVIDKKGIIRWAYVNEDYKVRAKIPDILKALDSIK